MADKKLKILIIDKDMCSVEIEIERWLFKQLNIEAAAVKKHKSKSSLNSEVTNFLKNLENT